MPQEMCVEFTHRLYRVKCYTFFYLDFSFVCLVQKVSYYQVINKVVLKIVSEARYFIT